MHNRPVAQPTVDSDFVINAATFKTGDDLHIESTHVTWLFAISVSTLKSAFTAFIAFTVLEDFFSSSAWKLRMKKSLSAVKANFNVETEIANKYL